ncbi:peptide-methionine (S)-S-oxide reductase MsrA [soil metagenome]
MNQEIATVANGCFWCTEAIFKRLKGVSTVLPGYTGGEVKTPTYEQVCSGNTGHTEAIQITFDPDSISYETILDIFWHTHNPTTLNQQGNDVGTQYRSAIFYQGDTQKEIAEKTKKELEESHYYQDPIVTEITPLEKFYPAEDYHKDYYDNNRFAPYCSVVIDPKIRKLMEQYSDKVKEEYH